MTESQVDMLTQIGMKKATEFAGKLGDARLTINWVNRYNGYFAGYMDMQAEAYQAAEIEKEQKNPGPKKAKKFERVLLYHPESDCYVECKDKETFDLMLLGSEPMDDVTGVDHHEANFLQQEQEKAGSSWVEPTDDFADLLG